MPFQATSLPAAPSPLRETPTLAVSTVAPLWQTSGVYLLARLIPASVALVSAPVFLRLIGPGEFGTFSLVMAFLLLLGNTGATWVTQGILRYRTTAGTGRQLHAVVRRATGATAVVVTLTGLVGVWALGVGSPPVALLAGAVLVSHVHFSVAFAWSQSQGDPWRILRAEGVRALLQFGLPLGLLLGLGIRTWPPLLLGVLGGTVAAQLLLWGEAALESQAGPSDGHGAVPLARLWRYGAPLALWMAISILLNLSDRFLIDLLLSREEVGLYSAIYDVVYRGTGLLLAPVVLAAHPVIMNSWNQGDVKAAKHTIRNAGLLMAVLGAILMVGWVAMANPVVALIAGSQAAHLGGLVWPVAAGAVAWQVAMVGHKPLELLERTGLMVVLVAVALAANVAGNLILLPRVGLVGAAWSTLLGGLLYLMGVLGATRGAQMGVTQGAAERKDPS